MGSADGKFLQGLVRRDGERFETLLAKPFEKLFLPVADKAAWAHHHDALHKGGAVVSWHTMQRKARKACTVCEKKKGRDGEIRRRR
jgi:hypothetical protein